MVMEEEQRLTREEIKVELGNVQRPTYLKQVSEHISHYKCKD